MKSHGVFKFIAIGLCALCLLSACGGLAGIICLSEGVWLPGLVLSALSGLRL